MGATAAACTASALSTQPVVLYSLSPATSLKAFCRWHSRWVHSAQRRKKSVKASEGQVTKCLEAATAAILLTVLPACNKDRNLNDPAD